MLFSIVIFLIYTPTNSVLGFLFPTSSPTFVVVCILMITTESTLLTFQLCYYVSTTVTPHVCVYAF
jgi:hypothetical protein